VELQSHKDSAVFMSYVVPRRSKIGLLGPPVAGAGSRQTAEHKSVSLCNVSVVFTDPRFAKAQTIS
jgi:hypothetical protein